MNLIPHLVGQLPLLGLTWMDPEWLLQTFGQQMFWISVVIIFIECGLLFPILPGDTLLFFIGIFIGSGDIHVAIVAACVIMSASAFLGNVVGYEIGHRVGPPLFQRNGRWLNESNLAKTHQFFDRYGNRALVLGRFVPIIRTYITVVAGAGHMERSRFFRWSFVGATLWATGLTLLGYWLGNISFLRNHLEVTLLLIVAVSLIPVVFEWWRQRRQVGTP
ncbi:MAG: rane-associated protein [Nocardioidaceae bacterium]|nr:rane-associated protein [Nocardioidaceae bacterium]